MGFILSVVSIYSGTYARFNPVALLDLITGILSFLSFSKVSLLLCTKLTFCGLTDVTLCYDDDICFIVLPYSFSLIKKSRRNRQLLNDEITEIVKKKNMLQKTISVLNQSKNSENRDQIHIPLSVKKKKLGVLKTIYIVETKPNCRV